MKACCTLVLTPYLARYALPLGFNNMIASRGTQHRPAAGAWHGFGPPPSFQVRKNSGERGSPSCIPRHGLLQRALMVLNRTQLDADVAAVMEYISEKDLERVVLEKDLERKILEKDIAYLEKELTRVQHEKLQAQAAHSAVLCNRHLLEVGLQKNSPKKSLSRAYLDFCRTELLDADGSLKGTAKQLLQDLAVDTKPADVAKELKDLIHELSKEIHYPQLKETGFVCGGRPPLGPAVAVAVCHLQSAGSLPFNVTFVDGDFRKLSVLSQGRVIKD
eukprot:TRINITY_DN9643_c0_g1_i5.p1 TRINITY_DN9643_c0_g1~~TRINITY_DN9643_c0_g1_i5.p1  ORF type:complete len:275 (-),score=50.34 TRINITY_DN9643_c0_g1_i5:86-910(-)